MNNVILILNVGTYMGLAIYWLSQRLRPTDRDALRQAEYLLTTTYLIGTIWLVDQAFLALGCKYDWSCVGNHVMTLVQVGFTVVVLVLLCVKSARGQAYGGFMLVAVSIPAIFMYFGLRYLFRSEAHDPESFQQWVAYASRRLNHTPEGRREVCRILVDIFRAALHGMVPVNCREARGTFDLHFEEWVEWKPRFLFPRA